VAQKEGNFNRTFPRRKAFLLLGESDQTREKGRPIVMEEVPLSTASWKRDVEIDANESQRRRGFYNRSRRRYCVGKEGKARYQRGRKDDEKRREGE